MYEIQILNIKELAETLDLVKNVFNEFEAPYYSKEGKDNFYKFIDFESIKKQLDKNMKIFVVKDKNKIVGMIAIRDLSHIALLFVDKKYQRQGIASKLMNKAIKYCKQNNSILNFITVNSSPYAVEFYHKKQFKDIDKEQKVDEIIFTPMKLEID